MKRNAPILGFVIGAILPLIGMLLFFFLNSDAHAKGLGGFFSTIFNNGRFGSIIISLSVLLNVIPFLYYTSKRLDYTARGLVIATMLYFVLMVLIKYVWN